MGIFTKTVDYLKDRLGKTRDKISSSLSSVLVLGRNIDDGRLVADGPAVFGRLRFGPRADAQVVEQPEDRRDERPCFHDSFPNIPLSVSAPAGKFP